MREEGGWAQDDGSGDGEKGSNLRSVLDWLMEEVRRGTKTGGRWVGGWVIQAMGMKRTLIRVSTE